MHDIDGATVSFPSLEIDQTNRTFGPPGDRSRVDSVACENATTDLSELD